MNPDKSGTVSPSPSLSPSESGSDFPIDKNEQSVTVLGRVIGVINEQLGKIQNEIATNKEDLKETKRQIEENKNKNIESLGLFVALFTFISIEFSLFKEVRYLNEAISITLIVAGLLTFFVLLLHTVIRSTSIKFYILIGLSLGFILLGLFIPKYFEPSPIKTIPTPTPFATPSATLIPRPN